MPCLSRQELTAIAPAKSPFAYESYRILCPEIRHETAASAPLESHYGYPAAARQIDER